MKEGHCLIEDCSNTKIVSRGYCQKHYSRWHRHGDPLFTKRTAWKVARANQTHQECVRCGRDLPMSAFSLRKSQGVRRRDCRECVAERARAYAKAHPEETKIRSRRRKLREYGLTIEQYETMAESQEHRCRLCGKPERDSNRNRLAVDHCHQTGEVRGLLCGFCNRQLGWLEGIGLEKVNRYLGR